MGKSPFVSIVMPCLNEEKTVASCVKKAKRGLKKVHLRGEIIVSDNGSTDKSVSLAKTAGARVVHARTRGYGSAYLTGIKVAKGNWIVIGDSDGTYNFLDIPRLLKSLEQGADLVLGSRFQGRLSQNAMPTLNRYLGTPILNLFLRLFYHVKLTDSQSGMRAFTKSTFDQLKMKTLGMEFASEMIVRASHLRLKVAEVPISYSSRIAPTKLSRFRDAWRHIRFMLLFAPSYLFVIPGLIFMAIGLIGVLALSRGPVWFIGWHFDFHSMILASLFALLGYQVFILGIFAKTYSWVEGLVPGSPLITTGLRYFSLEKGILVGITLSFIGFLTGGITFYNWSRNGFGTLWAVRPAILSMTFFVLGIEIIFSSFFLSILGLEKKK